MAELRNMVARQDDAPNKVGATGLGGLCRIRRPDTMNVMHESCRILMDHRDTGGSRMTIAQRLALVDEVDLEVWCTSDVPIMVNAIQYLNSGFPTKPVGIDSQGQGGFNINLWGSTYGVIPTTPRPTPHNAWHIKHTQGN